MLQLAQLGAGCREGLSSLLVPVGRLQRDTSHQGRLGLFQAHADTAEDLGRHRERLQGRRRLAGMQQR